MKKTKITTFCRDFHCSNTKVPIFKRDDNSMYFECDKCQCIGDWEPEDDNLNKLGEPKLL